MDQAGKRLTLVRFTIPDVASPNDELVVGEGAYQIWIGKDIPNQGLKSAPKHI